MPLHEIPKVWFWVAVWLGGRAHSCRIQKTCLEEQRDIVGFEERGLCKPLQNHKVLKAEVKCRGYVRPGVWLSREELANVYKISWFS